MTGRWSVVSLVALLTAFSVAQGQDALKCSVSESTENRSLPHLSCIELLPATGMSGHGVVRMEPTPSPFGISVTPDGIRRVRLVAELVGLPEPDSLGPYTVYVAWAADPLFAETRKLGVVQAGVTVLGDVALNKFLVIITAERYEDIPERSGPLVLRGQSPSNLVQPHDLFSMSPLAALSSDETVGEGEHDRHGAHHPAADAAGTSYWTMPPMHPKVPMAPGMANVQPRVDPFLPTTSDLSAVPHARPRELVRLADGDTLRLASTLVRRSINGRSFLMYGFNQQYPGPLIYVEQEARITIHFTNNLTLPTAVHWHGIRLDNRFDGVPGVTQEPVRPGETFTYEIHFPDAGIYWYHPHHREDIQQDLGLYGNMIVRSSDPDYYNPAHREEVLMLDDLLLDGAKLVPYGRQSANFMLMGRFGNVFLVNGEPDYTLDLKRGEVVRFFFTNVANTRTFNLHIDGAFLKVVGSDIGKFEREEWASSVVLAPAERYIIEAMFTQPGTYALTNRVHGFSHRTGSYFPEVDTLGLIHVSNDATKTDLAASFNTLREHPEVQSDIDDYRTYFDRPIDHEIVMTLEVQDLPLVVEQMMRLDRVFFNPVEWSDTMPMMNWASTGREVRWILRDPETGRENMDIDWSFRVGDVVKLRIRNDRHAFHAMQHPLHIHGQRFLVLERDGVPTPNMVWKDTVLLPVDSVTDLLVDLANPGRWMVHCHIAEHLESGMKMVINVEN